MNGEIVNEVVEKVLPTIPNRILVKVEPTQRIVGIRLETKDGNAELFMKLEEAEAFAKGLRKTVKKLQRLH